MSYAQEARNLVAKALRRSSDEIPDDGRLGTIRGWDSLGHISVIMELEAHLGRPVRAEEISALRSVGDVAALIAQK